MRSTAFKFSNPFSGCFAFEFKTQYGCASAFMRMQEFYESPDEKIRGKYADREFVMDRYADKHKGKMKYFSHWAGFNIRGDILLDWYNQHQDSLSQAEYKILQYVKDFIRNGDPKFCLVGYVKGDKEVKKHELSHAKFYLDPVFRGKCYAAYDSLKPKQRKNVRRGLKKLGYALTDYLAADEFQAYVLTTKEKGYVKKHFKISQKKAKLAFRL